MTVGAVIATGGAGRARQACADRGRKRGKLHRRAARVNDGRKRRSRRARSLLGEVGAVHNRDEAANPRWSEGTALGRRGQRSEGRGECSTGEKGNADKVQPLQRTRRPQGAGDRALVRMESLRRAVPPRGVGAGGVEGMTTEPAKAVSRSSSTNGKSSGGRAASGAVRSGESGCRKTTASCVSEEARR